MAKQKIKYYEIENLKAINKDDNMLILANPVVSRDNISLQAVDTARNTFLNGNPFLYYSYNNYEIDSIEEYYIKHKKYDMTLSDLISDPDIRLYKKRRIVKKTFKFWDKDFQRNKRAILKEVNYSADATKGIELGKFKRITIAFIYFFFFLTLLTVFAPEILWDRIAVSPSIYRIYYLMENHYQRFSWIWVMACSIVYIFIATIIYINIHNKIWYDFNKQVIYSQKLLESSKNKIDKSYKKKYYAAYGYYISRLRRSDLSIRPYPISKVMLDDVNLMVYEKISKAIKEKSIKMKKRKFLYDLLKSSLTVLCWIGFVLIVCFIVYLVFMDFFI